MLNGVEALGVVYSGASAASTPLVKSFFVSVALSSVIAKCSHRPKPTPRSSKIIQDLPIAIDGAVATPESPIAIRLVVVNQIALTIRIELAVTG